MGRRMRCTLAGCLALLALIPRHAFSWHEAAGGSASRDVMLGPWSPLLTYRQFGQGRLSDIVWAPPSIEIDLCSGSAAMLLFALLNVLWPPRVAWRSRLSRSQ